MADESITQETQDAAKPAPAPAQPSEMAQVEHEAISVAEQVGEAGLKAGVADMVSGNMGSAAEDVATAMEDEAEKVAPPIGHSVWGALKQWVRDEIEHVQNGVGRPEREKLNP